MSKPTIGRVTFGPTSPSCASCGREWIDHLGITGTCAELQRVKAALQTVRVRRLECQQIIYGLKEALREIAAGNLDPNAVKLYAAKALEETK